MPMGVRRNKDFFRTARDFSDFSLDINDKLTYIAEDVMVL